MARTANMLDLRIVRDSQPTDVPTSLRAVEDDTFNVGALLTEVEGNHAAVLDADIDENVVGPVSFIALEASAGGAAETFTACRIKSTTRLVGQMYSGIADEDDVGKQGILTYDDTTGRYMVNLTATAVPSIQVTSVDIVTTPFDPAAAEAYNLVEFKFLDTVLDVAPAGVSS